MSIRRKVVLTGAAGRIGSLLAPAFRERYEAVLMDARPAKDVEVMSLEAGRDVYRHYFEGADAVVHCAFGFDSRGQTADEQFRSLISNLTLAHDIYRVALESNVRRVVMCSTNHVAGYYEPFALDGRLARIDPAQRPLAVGLYGWVQEASEHLGFLFALGQMNEGRILENVQIRIGCPCAIWPAPRPGGGDYERRRRRWIAACVSSRDLVQLFVKSIEAPDIRDAEGVPFQVFYGISNNQGAYWSIENARGRVGYAPEDRGEDLSAQTARAGGPGGDPA